MSKRTERVGELVGQEVGRLLLNGLKDPRVGFVSVTGVKMTSDLKTARVYVSILGSPKEVKDSMVGLEYSAGWMRKQIGQRLRLRYTPRIVFAYDETLKHAAELEDIFRQIHEEEATRSRASEDEERPKQ
ncbi:30S ribosome-binding factor RbfA [Candidatus Hydrogenedentota bacterium]